MDWNDIDRLRQSGFAVMRRGYDQREVDKFLGSLMDWLETDASKQIGDPAVKRKLEHAGNSTARILMTTEDETATMLKRAQKECADRRSRAEAASHTTRQAADDYASKGRAKADEDARRSHDAAQARGTEIIQAGERRRADREAVISELEARRVGNIKELDRLRGELDSVIASHRSNGRSQKRKTDKPDARSGTANEAGTVATGGA